MQYLLRAFALSFSLALLFACGQPEAIPLNDENEATAPIDLYDFTGASPWFECPTQAFPEETVQLQAISEAHHYFGDQDRRTIETTVDFPDGEWAQVGLFFELDCPDGYRCDHWDRAGSLELLLNPDAPEDQQESIELLRYITPFGMGMCQYVDLTLLASELKGKKTLRSFIDTWVGPGHDQGEGWQVNARFVFTPGTDVSPSQVHNIFSRRNITVGQTAADENIASQIDTVSFELPENFSRVMAHLTATGHSFGNSLNCAEFCPMRQNLTVNDAATFSSLPWRGDCAENPVSPQGGTWQYNRNGWCPGAVATGEVIDISDAVQAGENRLNLDILLLSGQEYDNQDPVDLLPYTMLSLKLYVYP